MWPILSHYTICDAMCYYRQDSHWALSIGTDWQLFSPSVYGNGIAFCCKGAILTIIAITKSQQFVSSFSPKELCSCHDLMDSLCKLRHCINYADEIPIPRLQSSPAVVTDKTGEYFPSSSFCLGLVTLWSLSQISPNL